MNEKAKVVTWSGSSAAARQAAIMAIETEAQNAGVRAKKLQALADGYRAGDFADEHTINDPKATEDAALDLERQSALEESVSGALIGAIGELPLETAQEGADIEEALAVLRKTLEETGEEVEFAKLILSTMRHDRVTRRKLLFELLRDEARRSAQGDETDIPEPDELARDGALLFVAPELAKSLLWIRDDFEKQVLYGDGTTDKLTGILTETTADEPVVEELAATMERLRDGQEDRARELAAATRTPLAFWSPVDDPEKLERVRMFSDMILERWRSERGPRNYTVIDAAEGFESVKEILDDHGFDVTQDMDGNEPAGVYGVLGALVDACGLANTADRQAAGHFGPGLSLETLIRRRQAFMAAGLESPGRDEAALSVMGRTLHDLGLLEEMIPATHELELIDRGEIEKEWQDGEVDGELLAGASDNLEDTEEGRLLLRRLSEFSVDYTDRPEVRGLLAPGFVGDELVEVSLVERLHPDLESGIPVKDFETEVREDGLFIRGRVSSEHAKLIEGASAPISIGYHVPKLTLGDGSEPECCPICDETDLGKALDTAVFGPPLLVTEGHEDSITIYANEADAAEALADTDELVEPHACGKGYGMETCDVCDPDGTGGE